MKIWVILSLFLLVCCGGCATQRPSATHLTVPFSKTQDYCQYMVHQLDLESANDSCSEMAGRPIRHKVAQYVFGTSWPKDYVFILADGPLGEDLGTTSITLMANPQRRNVILFRNTIPSPADYRKLLKFVHSNPDSQGFFASLALPFHNLWLDSVDVIHQGKQCIHLSTGSYPAIKLKMRTGQIQQSTKLSLLTFLDLHQGSMDSKGRFVSVLLTHDAGPFSQQEGLSEAAIYENLASDMGTLLEETALAQHLADARRSAVFSSLFDTSCPL